MGYVLMIFYLGAGLTMHDFADAPSCYRAREIALELNDQSTYADVQATCTPKSSVEIQAQAYRLEHANEQAQSDRTLVVSLH